MSVTVEQGGWVRLERSGYPEDLVISGLGPCTGVFVVSPGRGVAFGAHVESPDEYDTDVLDDMLVAAATEIGQEPDVCVTLAGCAKPANQGWAKARAFVEGRVRLALPNARLEVRWAPGNTEGQSMVLDLDQGKCLVE